MYCERLQKTSSPKLPGSPQDRGECIVLTQQNPQPLTQVSDANHHRPICRQPKGGSVVISERNCSRQPKWRKRSLVHARRKRRKRFVMVAINRPDAMSSRVRDANASLETPQLRFCARSDCSCVFAKRWKMRFPMFPVSPVRRAFLEAVKS